jgi:hypothetical protein
VGVLGHLASVEDQGSDEAEEATTLEAEDVVAAAHEEAPPVVNDRVEGHRKGAHQSPPAVEDSH